MSKKITCVVTGKTYTISNEYFTKKVNDYTNEDNLKRLYTCREARNLLTRGYNQEEVCNFMKIEKVPTLEQKTIQDILLFSNNDINASQLSTMQTDPEVVKLIENLKGL